MYFNSGKKYLLFSFIVLLTVHVNAQSSQNKLQEFKDKNRAKDRFEYFFEESDRYANQSAFEWLDNINIYLTGAQTTRDSAAIRYYNIMRSQIHSDIEDYVSSIDIASAVWRQKESLDDKSRTIVLDLLDKNYGRIKLLDKQIEIREEKERLDLGKQVIFYDIYESMGLYRKARNKYIMAVKPTLDDNDFLANAVYYNKIGNYLRLDNSPLAVAELTKAKEFLEKYKNKKENSDAVKAKALEAEIEGNIGKALMLDKDYKGAIPYLENCIELYTSVNKGKKYNTELLENSLSLTEANLNLRQFKTARNLLFTDYGVGTTALQLQKNKLLARYFEGINKPSRAVQFYKANQSINDSLATEDVNVLKQQIGAVVGNKDLEYNRELVKRIENANEEMMSQLQEKDQRINLVFISLVFTLLGFAGLVYAYLKSIKSQNLIAEQKQFIEDSLKEKESLLKEIHHRVKNNLQMVSSLLSLQTKNTKDRSAIIALEEGKSRVKAMALIHQKLYQNDDLSVVEMQGYIESLVNSVQSVYKKGGHNIDINIDARGTELDIDRAIPFGLILNELVSNSFKYAFPEDTDEEGAQINIRLKKDTKKGFFEYTDNGIGLPNDSTERTKSSMGIRLVNRLVNQLQSKLNIDDDVKGVRFWFSFT